MTQFIIIFNTLTFNLKIVKYLLTFTFVQSIHAAKDVNILYKSYYERLKQCHLNVLSFLFRVSWQFGFKLQAAIR